MLSSPETVSARIGILESGEFGSESAAEKRLAMEGSLFLTILAPSKSSRKVGLLAKLMIFFLSSGGAFFIIPVIVVMCSINCALPIRFMISARSKL